MIISIMSLLAGMFVLLLVITMVRAGLRMRRKPEAPPPEPVFTMAELQQLLQAGQITQEEFDRLWPLVVEKQLPVATQQQRGFEVIPVAKKAPQGSGGADQSPNQT